MEKRNKDHNYYNMDNNRYNNRESNHNKSGSTLTFGPEYRLSITAHPAINTIKGSIINSFFIFLLL